MRFRNLFSSELTKYIEDYHQRLKSFDKINENLKKDLDKIYLVIQGTLIFAALTALVIQFTISFNY
jgi:uncharacterized membrane-anchored protein